MQNDERANYQLDVKFQESYLNKVVSLLQCQLSEGAVCQSNPEVVDMDNGKISDQCGTEEIEEGELPGSHGKCFLISSCLADQLYIVVFHVHL